MNETAGFTFGATRRLVVRLEDATLRAGAGAHRLDIDAVTRAQWLEQSSDIKDSASVSLSGYADLDGAGSKPIGPFALVHCSVHGWEAPEKLALTLTDEQLVALEVQRGQGDIQFRLNLQAVLLGEGGPSLISGTQVVYRLGAVRWIELLDGAGLGVALTFRVPTPLVEPGGEPMNLLNPTEPSFSQAGMRLRQARQALRDRTPEDAVQACRKVLEIIGELDPPATQAEIKKVTDIKMRDARLRWSALYWDLMSLTNVASHEDEVARAMNWSRQDADAVLASTAGLLARAMIGR